AAYALALVLSVFGCVVLHELGHSLAAARYGVRTRRITLLPIGGVAALERIPEDPRQELVIAAAGPLVNVIIAAGIFAGLSLAGPRPELMDRGLEGYLSPERFLQSLMGINIVLVLFNLLPAFPMDGGRILRALLAMAVDHHRATMIAARIGQALAVVFGIIGLLSGNVVLVLVALFVFLGAEAENQAVQTRAGFGGLVVRHAMLSRFRALGASDTLRVASEELLAGSQQDFPVWDQDRVAGILLRGDLIRALAQHGMEAPVGQVMRTPCPVLAPGEPLSRAYDTMRSSGFTALPVAEGGRLVGLVTLDNITELVMVRTAVHDHAARAPVNGRVG
ncbi:MAG TPA: site-2 protease family protein, partial [Phycisphaerales bacterium]|nr:site-2 protease family protein [Phycisphaerales bacterium]